MLTTIRFAPLAVFSVLSIVATVACSSATEPTSSNGSSGSTTSGSSQNPDPNPQQQNPNPSPSASSSSTSNPACSSIAGTFAVSGGCGPDVCVIKQNGCDTTFSCADGSSAFTGTVKGTSVSYSGTTAGGFPGTCSGTIAGNGFSGTCTIGGQTCSYSATKK